MNYKIKFKITNRDSELGHPQAYDASWEEDVQCDCQTEAEAHAEARAIMEDRYPQLRVECLGCEESPIQSRNKPANIFDPAELKAAKKVDQCRETQPSKGQGYD
jgi:hypothetical protein